MRGKRYVIGKTMIVKNMRHRGGWTGIDFGSNATVPPVDCVRAYTVVAWFSRNKIQLVWLASDCGTKPGRRQSWLYVINIDRYIRNLGTETIICLHGDGKRRRNFKIQIARVVDNYLTTVCVYPKCQVCIRIRVNVGDYAVAYICIGRTAITIIRVYIANDCT